MFIGIDTGLASTGIVILDKDGNLHSSINLVHAVSKAGGVKTGKYEARWMDRPADEDLAKKLPFKMQYPLETQANLRQIHKYYAMIVGIFQHLPLDGHAVKIAIEVPMGNHLGASAKVDRHFTAAFLGMLNASPHHWDIYEFNPSAIKKFVTGKGNSKKNLIIKEVYKKFNYDTDVDDMADAYAIAKLLVHTITGGDE